MRIRLINAPPVGAVSPPARLPRGLGGAAPTQRGPPSPEAKRGRAGGRRAARGGRGGGGRRAPSGPAYYLAIH